MKLFKLFLITSMVISEHLNANDISFQKGINVTIANMANIAATSIPYAVARNNVIETGDTGVQSFLETSDKKLWALSRSSKIHLSDMESEDHLGSWPLDYYSEHLYLAGEYAAATNVIAAGLGSESIDMSNPLREIDDRETTYFLSPEESMQNTLGCYQSAPLRYGDIDTDGAQDLILFLGRKIIIFSTQRKKVNFSMHYYDADEMSEATATDLEIAHTNPTSPQYLASSTEDAARIGKGGLFSAWRSLTKMYIGHYSSESSNDIVIWRKLYRSRLVQDPIKGFEKIGDVYVHYKLVAGEYQKQATPGAIIKSWLASKNLTWQKGYPSKSECPGQEGKLIPEMHDPLLNDPDVLQ